MARSYYFSVKLVALTVSVCLLYILMLRIIRDASYAGGHHVGKYLGKYLSSDQNRKHSRTTPEFPAPLSTSSVEFRTNRSLQLPYPRATRSLDEILGAGWVPGLWRFVSGLESRHVSLCFADSRYTEGVVNWLVSALVAIQPPLEHVLIISLDADLYHLLHHRGINTVFINPHTIIQNSVNLPTNFSHIWITRMVLFRLLNHWGYTVTTYDSDALLVKNPQALFAELEDSHLVGSEGVYPFDLHRQWKSPTLCMGVAIFRASEKTELFWNLLSEVQLSLKTFDDQVLINNALQQCSIVWEPPTTDSVIHGMCHHLGLEVTLLPSTAVCRLCSENREQYVWHQKGARSQEDKRRAAERGGVWFLKSEQTLEHGELKGVEWLRYLYSA